MTNTQTWVEVNIQTWEISSTGKSQVTAYLESQLWEESSPWVRLQRLQLRAPISYPRALANWYHHQSVTKLQLWFHVNAVHLVVQNSECCSGWGIPLGAQQSQDSFPILSMVLEVLHSQQVGTHSPLTVRAGWSKVRGLFCFVSEAWTRLFI